MLSLIPKVYGVDYRMPHYFQIYIVFIFNPIFTWTIFPSSGIWKYHYSSTLSREREGHVCLGEHPPHDASEFRVLQWTGAHWQQRESYLCFFINRLCHRCVPRLVWQLSWPPQIVCVWAVCQRSRAHVYVLLEVLWFSPVCSFLICKIQLRLPR